MAQRISPLRQFEAVEDRYIAGHHAWREIAANPTKWAEIAALEGEINAAATEMVAIAAAEVARLDVAVRASEDPQARQRRAEALAAAQRRRDGSAREHQHWREDRERMARWRGGDVAAGGDSEAGC